MITGTADKFNDSDYRLYYLSLIFIKRRCKSILKGVGVKNRHGKRRHALKRFER
jgi:hypothetical protein